MEWSSLTLMKVPLLYNLYIYIYKNNCNIYIIIWVIQTPKAVRGNLPSPSAFH